MKFVFSLYSTKRQCRNSTLLSVLLLFGELVNRSSSFPLSHGGSSSFTFRQTQYSTTAFRLSSSSLLSDTSVPPPLPPDPIPVVEQQILLKNGISMQVFSITPPLSSPSSTLPCLLFLHGSFHAAWCWREQYFPYFASLGYPVVACSWRGTGGTYAGDNVRKVRIMEHVQDLECLLESTEFQQISTGTTTTTTSRKKPIVICHSFGGLAVMKLLETNPDARNRFSGVITMCSVPPSGNGKMTRRFLMRSLKDSWKITYGFAAKGCLKSAALCRDLFFGGPVVTNGTVVTDDHGISDETVARYQAYFARDSEATIDLFDLVKQLPSAKTDENGRALFFSDEASSISSSSLPHCLVMGASDDFIVDKEGLQETATYFGLERAVIVDSPHDVMLGSKWQNAAKTIRDWIETTIL